VGNSYPLTKPEFTYLVDFTTRLGLCKRATKRVDPGVIELKNGTIIETRGGDDPRSLVGQAVNGCLLCEGSQVDLETVYRMMERVAETGGWIAIGGTQEKSQPWYGRYYQLWRNGAGDAKSYSLPSWSNTHIFPGGRQDPEILRMEREMPPEVFS